MSKYQPVSRISSPSWQLWATIVQICSSTFLMIRYGSASSVLYWGFSIITFILVWMYETARRSGDTRRAGYIIWGGSLTMGVLLPLLWAPFTPVALLCIMGGLIHLLAPGTTNRSGAKSGILISFLAVLWTLFVFETTQLGMPMHRLEMFSYVDADLRRILITAGFNGEWFAGRSIMGTSIFVAFAMLYATDMTQRLRSFRWHLDRTIVDLQESNHRQRTLQESLERQLNEQTQLLEINRIVNSTNQLPELLQILLQQLGKMVTYDRALITLLQNEKVQMISHAGSEIDASDWITAAATLPKIASTAIKRNAPLNIADLNQVAPSLFGACIVAPMIVRGDMIGVCVIQHNQCGLYDEHDVQICAALAGHAAAAVDSVRLRDAAARARVIHERVRLARNLHDSVLQAIFGVFLGIRTTLGRISQAPAQARDALQYSSDLAGSALANMRTLIFTLRPETLLQDGLVAALQSLVDNLRPHYPAQMQTNLPDAEPDLPLGAREALYRATSELMQHALMRFQCRTLRLTLRQSPGDVRVELEILSDENARRMADDPLTFQEIHAQIAEVDGRMNIEDAPSDGRTACRRICIVIPTSID